MTARFADATSRHPIVFPDGSTHSGTVHLDQCPRPAQFQVGAYTYASDFDPPPAPKGWAARLAPYLHEGSRETLRIGRFCQIAHGVRFMTASANHARDGITSYPFPIFDPDRIATYRPDTRDTLIGHDVWFGHGALVLPGAHIGSGAIIGAGAVVRGRVADYAVVAGNPAAVLKMRFDPGEINTLLGLAWWDWPADKITRLAPLIQAGDVAALAQAA